MDKSQAESKSKLKIAKSDRLRWFFLAGFALMGLFLLARSFAASSPITIEPEFLRLEGNAFVGHDDHDGTSPIGDGHYVAFGVPAPVEIDSSLEEFARGLSAPVDITNNGMAGDDRLFVVGKNGVIQIVNADGSVNPQPFLDITSKVSTQPERGLLGLAFHPNYQANGYFYIFYTDTQGDITISRYARQSSDAADPNSERILLTVEHRAHDNHNGGSLRFGPDGYLYIGVGDGGGGSDPLAAGQDINSNLGAILRIDVDSGDPYGIPPGNPFAGATTGSDEIFLYGMRNPWRFSFDRVSGDFFVADVGQGAVEEINVRALNSNEGHNYGWNCREGTRVFNASCSSDIEFVDPVYEYDHSEGCRSVTGGVVYRGSQYTELQGMYVFADYVCSTIFWLVEQADGQWVEHSSRRIDGLRISAIGEDVSGEVYIADITRGIVYKITSSHE